jgi:hypothetical protein
VFDDDFIDSYIDLKMTEVERFEMTPHPVEFDIYYSQWFFAGGARASRGRHGSRKCERRFRWERLLF